MESGTVSAVTLGSQTAFYVLAPTCHPRIKTRSEGCGEAEPSRRTKDRRADAAQQEMLNVISVTLSYGFQRDPKYRRILVVVFNSPPVKPRKIPTSPTSWLIFVHHFVASVNHSAAISYLSLTS